MKKHDNYTMDPNAEYAPVPFPEYADKYLFNVNDPDEIVNLDYYGTGRAVRCKITVDSTGHKQVHFTGRDGTHRNVRLAHIVWTHHNGPVPKGYIVHHVDKDRPGWNDISNLELMTASRHCSEHDREKWESGVFKGKGKAVICETDPEMRFETVTAAALELGVPQSSISLCCNGKLKTAGRMKWRFA